MNEEDLARGHLLTALRTVGAGFALALALVWLTVTASEGAMEVVVLLVSVGILSWFATVETERLVDEAGRLTVMPFGLAAVESILALAAAVVVQTGTLFLIALIAAAAPVVGLARAYRGAADGAR